MPKKNIIPIENKKPVEEVRYLEEQELSTKRKFTSLIFSYELLEKAEKLSVKLSGVDKKNVRWEAREIQKIDMPNYKKLLTNDEFVKYYLYERPWTNNEVKAKVDEWVNDYDKEGLPLGALTITNEQGDFMGYVLVIDYSKIRGEGVAEIGYVFFSEYWGKGVGYSVLSKMVEEWGPEVRRIGLGKGLEENNESHQKIKERFQCFGGRELRQFYATAKPVNIASWSIIEKVGFEPAKTGVENLGNPIDFSAKRFELPSLDNLFDYFSKIEYYIEEFYQNQEIEADKLYHMVDKYDKLYTFSKKSDGRIRFHYEKEVD